MGNTTDIGTRIQRNQGIQGNQHKQTDEMDDMTWPLLWRKRSGDAEGEGVVDKMKDKMGDVEKKIEDLTHLDIEGKTHMKPWMIMLVITLILVLILVLIGWCIWRFCKKKGQKVQPK